MVLIDSQRFFDKYIALTILSIGIGIYIYYTHNFEFMFFRISDLGFVNSHTLPECGGPGAVQKSGIDWKNDMKQRNADKTHDPTDGLKNNLVVGIGVTRQWIFGCDIPLGVIYYHICFLNHGSTPSDHEKVTVVRPYEWLGIVTSFFWRLKTPHNLRNPMLRWFPHPPY